MEGKIIYTVGDATKPQGAGPAVIAHICNDIGGWGKGFVLAISKRWPQPEEAYRKWFASQESFALGQVQFVEVENSVWVANIIGQKGILPGEDGTPPIRYKAVAEGLQKTASFALSKGASAHMPRIGCGLAGGRWDKIAPLIEKYICREGLNAYVYDFNR